MEKDFLNYLQKQKEMLLNTMDIQVSTAKNSLSSLAQCETRLDRLTQSITNLQTYLNLKEQGQDIDIKDYIDQSLLVEFFDTKAPNLPLFDEHSEFKDFISWFYDELPYIDNKHLYVLSKDKCIPMTHIILSNKIILDHENKRLCVHLEPDNTGALGELCLSGLNLYQIVTVSQSEMDKHILEQAEQLEQFDDYY